MFRDRRPYVPLARRHLYPVEHLHYLRERLVLLDQRDHLAFARIDFPCPLKHLGRPAVLPEAEEIYDRAMSLVESGNP